MGRKVTLEDLTRTLEDTQATEGWALERTEKEGSGRRNDDVRGRLVLIVLAVLGLLILFG